MPLKSIYQSLEHRHCGFYKWVNLRCFFLIEKCSCFDSVEFALRDLNTDY